MTLYLLLVFISLATVCHGEYSYRTEYLDVKLDHFTFRGNASFKLRYLINDTYWRPGKPVFLLTGSEFDIETLANINGFMWELAPQFQAMVLCAEHRYYGKSLPFGNESFSGAQRLGYLTSTQALADYVSLLDNIKKKYNADMVPVIAFGSSYGGQLAAWIRLKYPSSVFGAVASSAPIFHIAELTPCASFYNVIATVFNISAPKGACARNIKQSWKELRNITSTDEGRAWLSMEWKLCKPLAGGGYEVNNWLRSVYVNLAMSNYPYPTNFFADLPGYPIKKTCSHLTKSGLEGKALLSALGNALSVYVNHTGKTECIDLRKTDPPSLGIEAWTFQSCSEMAPPLCSDDNEMFERYEVTLKEYLKLCQEWYGVPFDWQNYDLLEYGGKRAPYSNVIFTNGLMDPWYPGGMLKTSLPSVHTILIPEGAHHLDLSASNPKDPVSVRRARMKIAKILKSWIKLFHNQR